MVKEEEVEHRENTQSIPTPNIYLVRGKERNGPYSKERIREFLADGQLDGANIIFFKLPGTDQHVAITVKENSGELTPGTRWLILGEFNFQRAIQLMDNNTGNTIKAPLVTAYYLVQEPK